jgi:hypothetical protein
MISYKYRVELKQNKNSGQGISNSNLPVSMQAWYVLLAALTGKGSPGSSAPSSISVNKVKYSYSL